MNNLRTMAGAMLVLASGAAMAAAPALHTSKSIVIDAPLKKVWDTAKDFGGLNNWHPAVAKDEIVEGKNDTAGAVRLLTLQDGGTIKEKLLSFNAASHQFRYAIVEGVLPVSDYTSTFVVRSVGHAKTSVVWSGHFKRKDTSDHPADKADDKTAIDTINGVYQSGLDNLKKILETAGK